MPTYRSASFRVSSPTGVPVLKRIVKDCFGSVVGFPDHQGRPLFDVEDAFSKRWLCRKQVGGRSAVAYLRHQGVEVLKRAHSLPTEDYIPVEFPDPQSSSMTKLVMAKVDKQIESVAYDFVKNLVSNNLPPALERVFITIDFVTSMMTANEFGALACVPLRESPQMNADFVIDKGEVLFAPIDTVHPPDGRQWPEIAKAEKALETYLDNIVGHAPAAMLPLNTLTEYSLSESVVSWRNRLVSTSLTLESEQLKQNILKVLINTPIGCLFSDLRREQ